MKKTILRLVIISLVIASFASCASAYENRKSRTCPSHDPMYFRR